MCVQFLYILFVRLCMGERASEPLCLSDITAQQSMTGGEATSGGEMWVILPTLLAPLFIPSAPRVWLLFHRWRRHPAVISLLLPVVFFFFLRYCCLFACRQQLDDFSLMSHSLFPFWILWFMGLAVVFSLKRHFELSGTLYSLYFCDSASYLYAHM